MSRYFITHPNFMDVFIEVVRIQYQDGKRVHAKIIWWNKSYNGLNPFPLHQMPDTLKVTREKWKEFSIYGQNASQDPK